jgi:hypothetical protein
MVLLAASGAPAWGQAPVPAEAPLVLATAGVSRSRGADVFLYGQGVHGNLRAAMLFLGTELDWRLYSVYEKGDLVLVDRIILVRKSA